jgi:hypothetical protein
MLTKVSSQAPQYPGEGTNFVKHSLDSISFLATGNARVLVQMFYADSMLLETSQHWPMTGNAFVTWSNNKQDGMIKSRFVNRP